MLIYRISGGNDVICIFSDLELQEIISDILKMAECKEVLEENSSSKILYQKEKERTKNNHLKQKQGGISQRPWIVSYE